MDQNTLRFRNRLDAGRQLAAKLEKYKNQDAVVYALPRGGVPVAREVTQALNCPLDLIIVRKIGHPDNPEYALGAVAEDGFLVVNEAELAMINRNWFEAEKERQIQEAKRRREFYLWGRKPLNAAGKIAILVDDGIATGSTMSVAIKKVRRENPGKIVVAVPVAPPDTAQIFARQVDEFVAIIIPAIFQGAIGYYYDDFSQLADDEVVALLKE